MALEQQGSGYSGERSLEGSKVQTEYFKQIGTYALAGAVLVATLYGAFRVDHLNAFLATALIGTVAFFSVTLVASILGIYTVAELWGNGDGVGNVFLITRRSTPEGLVVWMRVVTVGSFIGGAIGFCFALVGIVVAIGRSL